MLDFANALLPRTIALSGGIDCGLCSPWNISSVVIGFASATDTKHIYFIQGLLVVQQDALRRVNVFAKAQH